MMERFLNETGSQTDDEEFLVFDRATSWQPIYVTLILALMQISVFLTIFELGRRMIPLVYDRRRTWNAEKTPASPLRTRRFGKYLSPFLAFEWWRLSLTTSYQQASLDEYERKQREKQASISQSKQNEKGDEKGITDDDLHLEKAKAICAEKTRNIQSVIPVEAEEVNEDEENVSSSNTNLAGIEEPTKTLEGSNKKALLFHDEDVGDEDSPLSHRPTIHRREKTALDEHVVPWSEDWALHLLGRLFAFLRFRVFKMNVEDNDEPKQAKHEEQRKQRKHQGGIVRRPLSEEQQELLHYVGLDAFVTIRFLKFAFDVVFWPLLFACVILIPVFYTGEVTEGGYFATTASNLSIGSHRHWVIVVFVIVQYTYVLRRWWIEWELFIPLRYEYLESGQMEGSEPYQKRKLQKQYRHTCLVEYIPQALRRDQEVFDFFDSVFPGQVRRAEVLLNTEFLSTLIQERQEHIVAFEDAYAKYVHRYAEYFRSKDGATENGCCSKGNVLRREPTDPKIIVTRVVDKEPNVWNPTTKYVRDARTHYTFPYHLDNINRLNGFIDDEFFRLLKVQQTPPAPPRKENFLVKGLGLRYLVKGADTVQLHASTAFVEFTSLTAKQHAIQCNITGKHNVMVVSPVPPFQDILWENAHIAKPLIDTRRGWCNAVLAGLIIVWSIIVATIRAQGNLSEYVPGIDRDSPLSALLDTYIPVLVIEGLVRIFPHVIRVLAKWSRFKTISSIDLYVLRWYFLFRLVSFIFVIVGGSLVDSSRAFVDDPYAFVTFLAEQVPEQSQYFTSYVIVLSGGPGFFFMSQAHRLMQTWFINKVVTNEAVSERRLEKIRRSINKFASEELIPLYIFLAMIGLLYGSVAPLVLFFVAIFFKLNFKIYRFMSLYVYGTPYESGGLILYTLNQILFAMMCLMLVVMMGYLSIRAESQIMAACILGMLVLTIFIHIRVYSTFVLPSRTLALTKARKSDEDNDDTDDDTVSTATSSTVMAKRPKESKSIRGRRWKQILAQDDILRREDPEEEESAALEIYGEEEEEGLTRSSKTEDERKQEALELVRRRYQVLDSQSSHLTVGDEYFLYRQPTMNRVLWETGPRPYRRRKQNVQSHDGKPASDAMMHFDVWG